MAQICLGAVSDSIECGPVSAGGRRVGGGRHYQVTTIDNIDLIDGHTYALGLKHLNFSGCMHRKSIIRCLVCLSSAVLCAAQSRTPKTLPPSEEVLQFRLQDNPHDAAAHRQLIDLLEKKYAFRAIAIEDATWVKNNPTDSLALIELVSTATAALNDPEFAIAQLRYYLANVSRDEDPDDYDSCQDQLAFLLIQRDKPRESVTLLANLVRLHPDEAGLMADYGNTLLAAGQYKESLQAFRRALEMDPADEGVHQDIAKVLLKSGDLDGAEAEYRAAESVYNAEYKTGEPTDPMHSMLRSVEKIEAKSHSENALAELDLDLAHVLILEKKYDAAILETKDAFDADRNEFAALYLQAEIYDAQGNKAQAEKTRNAAAVDIQRETAAESVRAKKGKGLEAAMGPADPRIIFLDDTLWNGKYGYPALASEIVSILEPRSADLPAFDRLELANAYFGLGRIQDGKKQWEQAIADNPKFDTALSHSNLGQALLKAGDLQDAFPQFRRAYELDPQNFTFQIDYENLKKKLN